jgi:hypothetical protein
MSEDNVVILNGGDDDDSTIFQSTQDREKVLKEILDQDIDDSEADTVVDISSFSDMFTSNSDKPNHWHQFFG